MYLLPFQKPFWFYGFHSELKPFLKKPTTKIGEKLDISNSKALLSLAMPFWSYQRYNYQTSKSFHPVLPPSIKPSILFCSVINNNIYVIYCNTSPSPSEKIQIIGGKITGAKHCWVMSTNLLFSKVCWQCPAMFPPIIWIFTEGEGDGIKSRLSS